MSVAVSMENVSSSEADSVSSLLVLSAFRNGRWE